jgi:hypothetical protein
VGIRFLQRLMVGVSAFLVLVAAPLTVPAGSPDEVRPAQEVRRVPTDELGMRKPAGIAFDSVRGELLVAGSGSGNTVISRMGFDENLLGTFRLASVENPATLSFDPRSHRLVALDGAARLEVDPSGSRSNGSATTRIATPGVAQAESAAFDPNSGAWLVLSDGGIEVIDLSDPTGVNARIDPVVGGRVRMIATNPADGLLYAYAPDTGRLHALEPNGAVRLTFDLATLGLIEPVAMTFAPTSDPTDDPVATNLFIADAGGRLASGAVTEASLSVSAVALATTEIASLVRATATSAWSPGSPDPAGVAWDSTIGQLVVVDSEVEEVTGAGWNNVNLWRTTLAGLVEGTGTLWGPLAANGGYAREPTGAGYDPASATLFVSDDNAGKVFVVKRGTDGTFGTGDDIVTFVNAAAFGSTDTEDPKLESTTGHLFILDGTGREIYRVDPVDGVFGNGNDVMTQFDISHLGPTDFEGLASAPGRGTLYVGARATEQIFEISLTGSLIRTFSLGGINELKYISGLEVAPSTVSPGTMNFYIVDRAIDNGNAPTENDGKLFEVTAPDIGGPLPPLAPVALDDTASTAPGTAVVVDVLANDTDGNGDPLLVVGLTQPANGLATVVTGGVEYIPEAGFTGTNTFTYRASDGTLESNTATVTVTVAAPNVAPTAGNDSATTAEDTPVTIAVLGNDSDPESQPLTVQLASQPSSGSAVVNANDQTVTFTPSLNFNGQTSFTYRASDGINLSNLATVTVTVTAVNDPPVAVGDAAITVTDTAVTIPVLANDSDPDGGSLLVVGLTQPSNGSVQEAAGSLLYTPRTGFTGTDSFSYRAFDGTLESSDATVTVTVSEVFPAPVFRSASSAALTGAKGSILTIPAPSGVQPGDLLLAHIRYRGATPNLTVPVDWTLVGTIPGDQSNHSVYYKVAGPSEPASYQFNQNSNSGRMAGGIGAYSGVNTTNPIAAWAASASGTSTLIAPDAVSPVVNAMVVRLWGWRGSSATDSGVGFNVPPVGVFERWSQQIGHSSKDRNRVLAGDQVQLLPGAVGASTASGSASINENRRSAFTVILRPLGT